jgi:hypothetical protein
VEDGFYEFQSCRASKSRPLTLNEMEFMFATVLEQVSDVPQALQKLVVPKVEGLENFRRARGA